MAEELVKLFEALSSHSDLALRLSSGSVKLGFKNFYSILKYGVEAITDENGDVDQNKLGFECWNQSQIQSVLSFALSIVFATRSLSVDRVEPVVVATVHESIEFALCCLEKLKLNSDDLSLQNAAVKLLETGLGGQIDNEPDPSQSYSASSLVDSLPSVTFRQDHLMLEKHTRCNIQGVRCSSEEQPVDQLFVTLASDYMQFDNLTQLPTGATFSQDLNKLVSSSQHWAIVHLGCIPRLILFCRKLAQLPESLDGKMGDLGFRRKLYISLSILKLLRSLARSMPYVEVDSSVLQSIAAFADVLPSLFRPGFEFVSSHVSSENNYEGVVLNILEEFLHMVQLLTHGSGALQNVRACVLASILHNLDSNIWIYNKSFSNLKPPLVYFPRCVIYIVKLIEDVKNQGDQRHMVRDLDTDLSSHVADPEAKGVCHVCSEDVQLVKNYTVDELLGIIFSKSGQWVDNLMHLLDFLHSEGVKLRPKLERSFSTGAKPCCTSESESTVCHDDEALFGDLFSESGRSVGSNDGYDQAPSVVNPLAGFCNMIIQAASELLIFLKSCIFSPEWCGHVYETACKKLNRGHIDSLLSVLGCQSCCTDDVDGCTAIPEQKRAEQIHEICFELLHGLMKQHTLSDALEEYLVLQILKVENGFFVYNDQTVALLAHMLICTAGSSGSNLRNKVYGQFVSFVVEKEKAVSLECPAFKEVVGSLPTVFHMEILLMAFHLSSESEKVSQVGCIFSTLKTFASRSPRFSSMVLSSWALIVSRLVIVLRHMMLNPRGCPASLLLDFKSKLSAASFVGSRYGHPNESVTSWASLAVDNVLGLYNKEELLVSNLLNVLVD